MSDKPIKPARNRQTLEARITSLSNETGRPVRRIQRAVGEHRGWPNDPRRRREGRHSDEAADRRGGKSFHS